MFKIALFIVFMLCQPVANAATEVTKTDVTKADVTKDNGSLNIANTSTYEISSDHTWAYLSDLRVCS